MLKGGDFQYDVDWCHYAICMVGLATSINWPANLIDRWDRQRDIDQLKNGVNTLVPTSDSLLSNWALIGIASMAWDLKAWFGLLLPFRPLVLSIVRMEFKRFLNTFIRIPCLIIRTGRRIIYRFVEYNDKMRHVIRFFEAIKLFNLTKVNNAV